MKEPTRYAVFNAGIPGTRTRKPSTRKEVKATA